MGLKGLKKIVIKFDTSSCLATVRMRLSSFKEFLKNKRCILKGQLNSSKTSLQLSTLIETNNLL